MRCKKGLLPLEWFAAMVVLIVGAGILIVFFSQVINTSNIDKDICKTSVITRATLPFAKGYIPLNCQTEKICITGNFFGKGNCEEFENEGSVKSIRIGNNKDGLAQAQKIYAQEILSCWELMGGGRLSLFSQAAAENFGAGSVHPTCVVCSRVAIDHESLDKVPFQDMDVDKYMRTHAIGSSKETYFDRMLGKGYAPYTIDQTITIPSPSGELDEEGEAVFGKGDLKTTDLEVIKDPNAKVSETGIIFMQITAPGHGSTLKNAALAVIGVGAVGSFVPGAKSVTKKAIGSIGGVVLAKTLAMAMIVGGVVQQANVAHNRYVTAGYCGDIGIGSDARSGCSAVRTIDYTADSLTEFCEVFEGIS